MHLALLRGVMLGFVGAIPVGPVNASVIDVGLRKCFRRALAIGVGGAFVDFIYSQIAAFGLLGALARFPDLQTGLLLAGGVILVAFGVFTVGRPPAPPPLPVAGGTLARSELVRSFLTGVAITVMNPANFLSWFLLAGTVLAGLDHLECFVAGLGIFAGTVVWFVLLSFLAVKGRVKLGARAAWVTRTVGALLVVYGVFLVGKASATVFASGHR
jgi:threonine/homoserine/homoserine lactone efflux protein